MTARGENLVLASSQYLESAEETIPLGSIRLNPKDEHSATLEAGDCPGREEKDGYIVLREKSVGDYCIVAVVPVTEVVAAIESQRPAIMQTADEFFVTSLVIILICFFAFVLPCAGCIAYSLSKPLVKTAKESGVLVQNIGGDLFKGLSSGEALSSVGEVSQLRAAFTNIILELKAKRDRSPLQLPDVIESFEAQEALSVMCDLSREQRYPREKVN